MSNPTSGTVPSSNYCSFVPDIPFGFDFRSACARHDSNYAAGSTMSRLQADQTFRQDLHNICTTEYGGAWSCHAMADVYFIGVRAFGAPFYEGSGGA